MYRVYGAFHEVTINARASLVELKLFAAIATTLPLFRSHLAFCSHFACSMCFSIGKFILCGCARASWNGTGVPSARDVLIEMAFFQYRSFVAALAEYFGRIANQVESDSLIFSLRARLEWLE